MQKTRKILFLLGFLLALFTGFRLLFAALYFYAGNYETAIWLKAFYWGLRIDFTLLFVANLPLFLFIFFLDNIFKPEVYKRISWLLACIVNIPLVLIELLDIGYFRYIQRRSNMDLFTVAGDAIPAYKQFIADFWWLLLIAGGAVFIMIRVFKKITCALPVEATSWKQKLTWVGFLIMGLVLARGLQSRPIIPATPFLYLPAGLQPLSVNSSYSLVYSLIKGEGRLAIKDYFSGEELDQLYKIRKKIPVKGSRAEADSSGGNSVRKNIVIFILESFAKEYLDPADPLKAETPFLDSIAASSIFFDNAFANGLQSNQGIVAILASITPITDVPYFYSSYSGNKFVGIGSMLKKKGYQSFFFMGAEKDHFGFEKLTRIVGIDKYYSGEDYGNKNHHDGNWGIFDHYFLEYTAQKLAEADTPFLATVFNISSHPPYTIPKEFEQNWPGQNRARKSISYADYAIRRFFEKIKQEAWYNNTVFVFVADHSVRSLIADDANAYNSFRIPLFFHEPGRGVADTLSFPVQQTDIVPSLLELLSYNESFTSFGTWISDTSKRYIYNRYGDNIQVFDDEWMLGFHPAIDKALYFYNYRKDPQLKINLLGAAEEAAVQRELEIRVKAFLQRYNGAMIKNGLMAD